MFLKSVKSSLQAGIVLLLCLSGLLIAKEQNPESVEDYLKLGKEYFQKQEYQKAVENYKAAIVVYPDNVEAHFYLGKAYWKLNLKQSTIDSYNKALEVDSEYKPTYYSLARCYISVKRYREALKTYQKLAAILKRNVEVVDLIAGLNYLSGNYEGCIKIAKQIIDAESNYFSAHFQIGISHLALGDSALAEEWLTKAQEISKKHYNVAPCPNRDLLGELAIRAKHDEKLKNILESVVELTRQDLAVLVSNPAPGFFELSQKPKETSRTNPHYPTMAIKRGIQGEVVVKVLIGTTGNVLRAEIVKDVSYLTEAALKAAYQFRFKPGKINGEEVMVWVSIPFNFRLK